MSTVGCEPEREDVLASQKPNALPTELSGRPSTGVLTSLYADFSDKGQLTPKSVVKSD